MSAPADLFPDLEALALRYRNTEPEDNLESKP